MAILLRDMAGGQRPAGSSCGWNTTDLRYWRGLNSVCFLRLQIRGYDVSGGRGPYYGIRGGWWSGLLIDPVVGDCGGGSDPLVSFARSAYAHIFVDVWRALAQGLWTSSLFLECIPVVFADASRSAGVYVGPETGPAPATINRTKDVPTPGSCANGVGWSITVRDDGTFSVA